MNNHYQKTLDFYKKKVKEKEGQYNPPSSLTFWAQKRVKKIALSFLENERIKQGDFLLDAGCATGYFSSIIALRFPKANIIGVDFSEEMIKLAQQKNKDLKNLKFQKADLLNLNLPKKNFTATFCLDTLHHILPSDLEKVLKNLAMVTQNILILEIKNRGLAKKISNYLGRLKSIDIYETKSSEVANVLKKYGFRLEKEMPVLGIKVFSPISVLKFRRDDGN